MAQGANLLPGLPHLDEALGRGWGDAGAPGKSGAPPAENNGNTATESAAASPDIPVSGVDRLFTAPGPGETPGSVPATVIVVDRDAGFVTGGGWSTSPEGAHHIDNSTGARLNLGFSSKYQGTDGGPRGQIELQYHGQDRFNFHSTSQDWLLVFSEAAQVKGSGTIDGAGDYGFLLSAIDSPSRGQDASDLFRVKIWEKSSGTVIYDTQPGDPESAKPTTALGGGNISIHAR